MCNRATDAVGIQQPLICRIAGGERKQIPCLEPGISRQLVDCGSVADEPIQMNGGI